MANLTGQFTVICKFITQEIKLAALKKNLQTLGGPHMAITISAGGGVVDSVDRDLVAVINQTSCMSLLVSILINSD